MNKSQSLLMRAGAVFVLLVSVAATLLTHTSASASSTMTFKPGADAYVSATYPNTNYGTGTTLRVDGSPDVRSYLRFTVSGLNGATITAASLQIYANSGTSIGLTALSVASNTWGETTITYGNKPALGTTLGKSGSIGSGSWSRMDVSSYVKAEGTYSFGVITTSSTAISLASRESGSNSPKLVLTLGTTTTSVTPTATKAVTPTPTAVGNTPTPTPAPTAGTYYVNATGGSDSNPGTQTSPWLTIQKAANTLNAGQTVVVEAGTYNQRVSVTRSGSSGAPITFQASGTVVMQGFTIKANYITVKGFEITNSIDDSTQGVGLFVQGSQCVLESNYIHDTPYQGILITAPTTDYSLSSNCTIKNNRIYRASQAGIQVRGTNHLVVGNEVWASVQYPAIWTTAPSWADADGIQFFGGGHIIRHNYVHDIPVETAENVNPHVDCYETWADSNHLAATNVTLEQNRCNNVQGNAQNSGDLGSGFQIQGASGLIIRNNVIYADCGLLLYGSQNVSILNNDFIASLAANPSFYPIGAGLHDSTSVSLENDIFYNQASTVINVTNTSLQSAKNLEYRSDGQTPQSTSTYPHGSDLWGVNPLFVNVSGGDYHLQSGSPAIDAGASMTLVPNDYYGAARPQGAGYDIGGSEY